MALSYKIMLLIPTLLGVEFVQAALPSKFYKAGSGIFVESWASWRFSSYSDVPHNLKCPNTAQTFNKFELVDSQSKNKNEYLRIRSYFVSPQTGNHRFIAVCSKSCRVRLYSKLYSFTNLIYISSGSQAMEHWTGSKMSGDVKLLRGFRYLIDVASIKDSSQKGFFKLGVKFPDNIEVKPIDSRYLRRSMEFYKWKGFLMERYQPMPGPYTSVTQFQQANTAKYPAKPDSVSCRNLYNAYYYNYGYNVALRYTGYFTPARSDSQKFKMTCNAICSFALTKSSTETITKIQNSANREVDVGPVALAQYSQYFVEAFTANDYGRDYLQVRYRDNDGDYEKSWASRINNLDYRATRVIIPYPEVTVLNSTSVKVRLSMPPSLPPNDNWTSVDMYGIFYQESISTALNPQVVLNGSLPVETVITGLKKYTNYRFLAYYYGEIDGSYTYNLISGKTRSRTAEDVPSAAPGNFRATTRDSTTIVLQWDILSSTDDTNGIVTGYELKYAVKETIPKTWTSVHLNSVRSRIKWLTDLQKYTMYQFQVAAKTSKGTGVFSQIVEARTAQSAPTAAPSNITADNTSSSSIIIAWDEVVKEHQNGVITKYTVYIRESSGWVHSLDDVLAPKRSYEKAGLKLWTRYNVHVAASTSVGRGPFSSVVKVQTDEDIPSAPPRSINTTALSSSSIMLEWANIEASQTNGIIISYEIEYRRKDRKDVARTVLSHNNTISISGLEFYMEYDFRLAGTTRKGRGTYSSIITERTLEDVPSGAPTNLRGNYISSTAIYIQWNVIPVQKRNGIISQYTIRYRLNDSNAEWKSETVSASTFHLVIRGLNVYSLYEFVVAGRTFVGLGPYSRPVVIRSDAHAPTRPPSNLSGNFINHTSIRMTWSRVPKGFRSGIILGYKLRYKDGTSTNANWVNITIPNRRNDPGLFNKTISGLKFYTPYIFVIAGFTYRGEGVYSREVTVWTDEYIPEAPPKNISSQNITSTGMDINWKDLAEKYGIVNGKVLGYYIRYRVTDCYEDRPKGCDESKVFMATTQDANPHISLNGLRKFTNYSITVQVFNKKGQGNISAPVYFKTAEDKPDAAPTKVESWPSKYNSIQVYWSPVPESLRNGIITGYRIFYKPIDVPLQKYNRAPRSVNPFAVYGAIPGEKMLQVNASTYQIEIQDLKEYSWYHVRIAALTSKGLGVTFSFNATCKQGSPISAPEFYITDKYDFYEIQVNWGKISRSSARGEVLGYRIRYWPIEINDQPVFETEVSRFDVLANISSLVIKNLQPYVKYGVTVSAFTEGGFGVLPEYKTGETCRCPMTLTTTWMRISPLISGNKTMTGILPKYVEEAVDICCGNCSGGQGTSQVDWVNGGSNSSSLQYEMHGLHEGILAGSHITVPLFRDTTEVEGNDASLYDYVPFVISPGMAVFKRKPALVQLGNEGATNMANSVFCLYPLLVVMVLITALAGMVFWFLERGDNTDEFPDDFFRGSGSGFWLAFITMTTAGYGDIAPKTILGRIFAVIWTLVGIVVTALIVGSLANALASTSVTPVTTTVVVSTKGKTLASDETFMISIVQLRSRTVIGNTSDHEFVKQALLSGNVSRVIIEAYNAAQFKDALEDPDIEFDSIKKVKASYGVALRGPARRIKHCLNRFVQVHSQHILEELNEHPVIFERGESSEALKTEFLISADADITVLLNKFGGITLAGLIFIGAVYDIIRWLRGRAKISSQISEAEKIFLHLNEQVEEFVENSFKIMNELDLRHGVERFKLANMDIKDLKAMAPDLTIFDEDLRPKHPVHAQHCKKDNSVRYDDADESDFDHPMDAKTSEQLASEQNF